jgi:hypothetical protein
LIRDTGMKAIAAPEMRGSVRSAWGLCGALMVVSLSGGEGHMRFLLLF